MKAYQFILISLALILCVSAKVEVLDPKSFDKFVGKDKPALVEFFAPWCGHCKKLAPIWQELGAAYDKLSDKIVIAQVDADSHKDLAQKYQIKGFPTIKFFPAGSKEPKDYTNDRSLEELVSFIKKETGLEGVVPRVYSNINVLDASIFDNVVFEDPDVSVMVEFYAPWCGHCKNLAPVYEKIATDFLLDENIIIAKVDATANTSLAERYNVKGYPHIVFFEAGKKNQEDYQPIVYDGGRDEQALLEYINGKCGTHRVAGGKLDESAGRIKQFDDLVKNFVKSESTVERDDILKSVKKLASTVNTRYSNYYAKVMEKVINNENYLEKEINRLTKIIDGNSMSIEKIDDFTIRRNILKAFQKD